jgi:hypothetical protein
MIFNPGKRMFRLRKPYDPVADLADIGKYVNSLAEKKQRRPNWLVRLYRFICFSREYSA